ncbi:MAG: S8 family peptidase [Actinomycetota bacterium]
MQTKAIIATIGLVVGGILGPVARAGTSLPPRLDPGALEGPSPRAIALFSHEIGDRDIERLAAAGVTHAAVFEAIDSVAILGSDDAYIEVARWSDVERVHQDAPITFNNYIARSDTRVDDVRAGKAPLRTGYTGKGVTVAVLDSGVDTSHPDFSNVAANINMEPSWFMDDISDGQYSQTSAEQPIGTDEVGHGTHVAGIVGGTGAAGVNVDQSGVAPGASLVNCKIVGAEALPSSLGVNHALIDQAFESNALACYDWILDHRDDPRFPGGIRVVSNSWGFSAPLSDPPGALVLMLREVVAKGVSVAFSAGNGGPGDNTVNQYPAAMEEVITVGATCKSNSTSTTCEPGGIADFSSRGEEVDVVAPGRTVWSARAKSVSGSIPQTFLVLAGERPGAPDDVSATRNLAWYTAGSGTSMAVPHVAGIVALMIEANPTLTPARIEELLTRTATDRGELGFDHDYGFGLVNALAAVRAAERAR